MSEHIAHVYIPVVGAPKQSGIETIADFVVVSKYNKKYLKHDGNSLGFALLIGHSRHRQKK